MSVALWVAAGGGQGLQAGACPSLGGGRHRGTGAKCLPILPSRTMGVVREASVDRSGLAIFGKLAHLWLELSVELQISSLGSRAQVKRTTSGLGDMIG